MKSKLHVLLVLCLLTAIYAHGQEFNKGTNVINTGIGFGGQYGSFDTTTESPVFSASYERGIWEVPGPGVVSLGGYLGYKTYSYDYNFDEDKWTYVVIGVRGAYHYNGLEVENLDVYGGVMLSYNIVSYSGSTGSYNSRPDGTFFLGGRWFFTNNFAVYAEGGYGVAFLTLGASFRF